MHHVIAARKTKENQIIKAMESIVVYKQRSSHFFTMMWSSDHFLKVNCKQTKSVRIEQLDIVERFLPTKMFPETTFFHGEKYFRRLCMRDRFVEKRCAKTTPSTTKSFSAVNNACCIVQLSQGQLNLWWWVHAAQDMLGSFAAGAAHVVDAHHVLYVHLLHVNITNIIYKCGCILYVSC